ncbi:heterodisulfide reductase, partial [Methanosarcinales archaeon]
MKTGIFLCGCGGNISDVIDLKEIKEIFESEKFFVKIDEHLCSNQGCRLIANSIKDYELERIVIAACSPMIHENRFKKAIADLLNLNFLQIANIREQCGWVHSADEATRKAVALIGAKVERVKYATPQKQERIEPYRKVAVIGGGVSGITAALSLAKCGIEVYLMEQDETIGGHMVQIGKVFSPDKIAIECALRSLAPIMSDLYN